MGPPFGDLFNDGKTDVIINLEDGPPTLLRNVHADTHHWIEIKLVGAGRSPRDAIGATVYLTANGMRHREDIMSGGSYVSSNDQRLHFGLGDAKDGGSAEIHWPSGSRETVKLDGVDRIYTITEAKGITAALCGGTPCSKPLTAATQQASGASKAAFASAVK